MKGELPAHLSPSEWERTFAQILDPKKLDIPPAKAANSTSIIPLRAAIIHCRRHSPPAKKGSQKYKFLSGQVIEMIHFYVAFIPAEEGGDRPSEHRKGIFLAS